LLVQSLEPFVPLFETLAAMLGGGDRRSIGRSEAAVKLVLQQPEKFGELLECLWSEDPVLRMRAADAAEKISAKKPRLLDRHKAELLGLLAEAKQIELRWHLAQMIPRLPLTAPERRRAAGAFERYLEDRSSIVKTCALEGLADLARWDVALYPDVKQLLESAVHRGTPAMKARARKLLARFLD
jgi:hypothetical protein